MTQTRSRNVNQEYLQGLEVISNKEFALPGAKCRGGSHDPRFTNLPSGTAEAVLFNHLATVIHKGSEMVFVAFKKTMDALHMEQTDVNKYPAWLMDSDVKKTELDIYIHAMRPPFNANPQSVLRDKEIMDVSAQTRVHIWLSEITTPWVFDTVAFYLLKNSIISQDMYGKIK